MEKWDGKTKGGLWGYKFFIFLIKTFGIRFSYSFCFFVSIYYIIFAKKEKNALIQFHKIGFGKNYKESKKIAFKTFFNFGKTLIDRVAILLINKENSFTYTFNNENALRNINENKKGGILISGHLGNWENAGNLLHKRITNKINIVMLDSEVKKIKSFLNLKTGGPLYNIIPIKSDLSHLILIHKALKNNELIALHADRVFNKQKTIELDFLNHKAKFPIGPFVLASKFKVPITFVYAVKESNFHYNLYASDPINEIISEQHIAKKYVSNLEMMVRKYPTQWFNFFEYYDN